MRYSSCLLVLMLSCWLQPLAYAKTTPSFPENATVEIVAENMLVNGLLTAAWSVQSALAQEEFAAFYRNQWQAGSDHFDERTFAGDLIINSVRKPFIYTARINSDSLAGTTALISVSSMKPEKRYTRPHLLPELAGNTILNTTEHNEPIGYARTQVLQSVNSLGYNFDFYKQHFKSLGWSEELAMLDPAEGMAVLLLNSSKQQLSLTFEQQSGKIMIVANEIWGKGQ